MWTQSVRLDACQELKTIQLKRGKREKKEGLFIICKDVTTYTFYKYMIMNKLRLSIYTSMKHSLLSLKLLVLALNSLDTPSDVRIKAFMLLF